SAASAVSGGSPIADAAAMQARAEALALARSGSLAAAIALATEANRRTRDVEIERWLVRWRHQLGDAAAHAGPAGWPPQLPDLFVGCTFPAPEVTTDGFRAATLGAGIQHHGCLIVRGLVPPAEAQQLASNIDRVFDAVTAATLAGAAARQTPWYAPLRVKRGNEHLHRARLLGHRGGGILTCDSPRMLFELLEVFERRGVISTVAEYLGERPMLSAQKAALRRVPPTSGTDWHQDGAFLGAHIRAVNVWVALSDCGVDSPGLDFVPRRLTSLVETGTPGAKFRWSVAPAMVDTAAGEKGVAAPRFAAGDAILFDQLFLHRTGIRSGMTRTRWASESWLFAPTGPPEHYYPVAI
ncbi:MAG: phytanoyl-CoA dioxygenase family protein, partial [Vicinamibacterales bacterium]